jgi:transcriptional regulator with XRE-family HTH domain
LSIVKVSIVASKIDQLLLIVAKIMADVRPELKPFADHIRQAIAAAGESTYSFANKYGISPSTLSAIVRAKMKPDSVLPKLAEAITASGQKVSEADLWLLLSPGEATQKLKGNPESTDAEELLDRYIKLPRSERLRLAPKLLMKISSDVEIYSVPKSQQAAWFVRQEADRRGMSLKRFAELINFPYASLEALSRGLEVKLSDRNLRLLAVAVRNLEDQYGDLPLFDSLRSINMANDLFCDLLEWNISHFQLSTVEDLISYTIAACGEDVDASLLRRGLNELYLQRISYDGMNILHSQTIAYLAQALTTPTGDRFLDNPQKLMEYVGFATPESGSGGSGGDSDNGATNGSGARKRSKK